MIEVRAAEPEELDALVAIWHDAWHEAHDQLVPGTLSEIRTRDNFRERMVTMLPAIRVAGPAGNPVGFCLLKGEELYQLFVARTARGTGAAAALVADAESRLAAEGVEVAWLACAIGNLRAAAFYRKCGWRLTGVVVNQAETPTGNFALEVWRFEKRLGKRGEGSTEPK